MFDLYKPLRNYLRQFSWPDALSVCYHYFLYLQYKVPLPKELKIAALDYAQSPYHLGLNEWELDTLAREVVINAAESQMPKSFRNWSAVSKAINQIKHIENETWGRFEHSEERILLELNRIAHRQFPWQKPIGHPAIARYFKIFSTPSVDQILHQQTNLTAIQLFRFGLYLNGHFLRNPIATMSERQDERILSFVSRFSSSFSELKARTTNAQSYDVNWAYNSNPLRDRPLIVMGSAQRPTYFCPIQPFLLRRFTEGIYYELVGKPGFDQAFGGAFQTYFGSVVAAVNAGGQRIEALPEQQYFVGSRRKDSVDWIVQDNTASLFVECKTKRMGVQAKVNLLSLDYLRSEVDKLATFIVQNYKSIYDAEAGLYDHWKPRGRPIYPIIVTLENWHALGAGILDELNENVLKKLQDAQLETNILERLPYTVSSIEDFEVSLQVMAQTGIHDFMSHKTSPNVRSWSIETVASQPKFSAEYSNVRMLFPTVMTQIRLGTAE